MVKRFTFDAEQRLRGSDYPPEAETMVGLKRLDNLQHCIPDVLSKGVPGDLIEAGVWREGGAIFMRAVLKAFGDNKRIVWVADSFQGLPKPDGSRYPADAGDSSWKSSYFAVPVDQVKANFIRYGLLNEQVRFLVGWFRDTLKTAPMKQLAVLRIDADLYESTIDALRFLYPKLSVGRYIIIDDYGCLPRCKEAVDDFRRHQRINEPLQHIDWSGVFWQRVQ